MHGPHIVKVGYKILNLAKLVCAEEYGLKRPAGAGSDMAAALSFENGLTLEVTASEWRELKRLLTNHHLPGAER